MTNASLAAPECPPDPADSRPSHADDWTTRPAQAWTTVIDGHELQRLRRQVGLSQAKLADQAQVGMSTVARLERQPRARCRTWTLARIATALGEPQHALRPTPTADTTQAQAPACSSVDSLHCVRCMPPKDDGFTSDGHS
jgi:DNA-binding XRE family transcriptional regulator